jgi:hypothetical protein
MSRACGRGRRLRTKDVKSAITARKAVLAEQQAALTAVLAAGDGAAGERGIHPLERPDIPADVKVRRAAADYLDPQASDCQIVTHGRHSLDLVGTGPCNGV